MARKITIIFEDDSVVATTTISGPISFIMEQQPIETYESLFFRTFHPGEDVEYHIRGKLENIITKMVSKDA